MVAPPDDSPSSLALDDRAGAALIPLPSLGSGWRCTRAELIGQDEVRVRFDATGSSDLVEVRVLPRNVAGAVFRRLTHCAVRYSARIGDPTPEARAQVGALVLGTATAIDARLGASAAESIADAFRGPQRPGRIVFSRESLREMLAPDIVVGAELFDGWQLVDVFPSSNIYVTEGAALQLVLDFRRGEGGERLLLQVGARDDKRSALSHTTHLSLRYLSFDAGPPPSADTLLALVTFVLQVRDHEALELVFPDVASDLAARLLPAREVPSASGPASDEVLNLSITSECGHQCVFCSVKDVSPPSDGDAGTYARLCEILLSNRERGVRAVRVNGYDPLAHPRILDLLQFVTDVGYESVHVFSPFTLLADRAFCARIVDALPPARRFHIPIYGADAATHDAVVGKPGAHALLLQAIANLRELAGPGSMEFATVVVAQHVSELANLAKWVATLDGEVCRFHLAYPSHESRSDRYFGSTARMTDVADAMADAERDGVRFRVRGVLPCVTYRAMRARGIAPRDWLEPDESAPVEVPGTEYRDRRYLHRAAETGDHSVHVASTVPCPSAGKCALAPVCSRELLRSYADVYGIEELVPVTVADLLS